MLTLKQIKFCKSYIETGNASESYRRAYDAENMSNEAIRVEACRLLQKPNVALTVEKMQKQAMERHLITVDSLIEELEEARRLALETQNPNALQNATMSKAKLLGLDKQAESDDEAPRPQKIEIFVKNARKQESE